MRNSALTCDTSTFICSFPLTYFFGVLTFLDYFFIPIFTIFSFKYFAGDKAKGRISNRVFQENKARQIFRKRTFLTPLIRRFVPELISGARERGLLNMLLVI